MRHWYLVQVDLSDLPPLSAKKNEMVYLVVRERTALASERLAKAWKAVEAEGHTMWWGGTPNPFGLTDYLLDEEAADLFARQQGITVVRADRLDISAPPPPVFLGIVQFGPEEIAVGLGATEDEAADNAVLAYEEKAGRDLRQTPDVMPLVGGNRVVVDEDTPGMREAPRRGGPRP